LFSIGCHLAELITDIRSEAGNPSAAPQVQRLIDQLNGDFGNFRELFQTSEPSVADALLHPVLDRFTESSAAVALARPDLSAKCESLTSSLTKFLDPHPTESTGESGDLDIPF
jgi:glutathione S-transferase